MKQINNLFLVMLALASAVGFSGCSDDDDDISSAPTSIQTAFASQYPNATGAEWELTGGYYEVDFYYSGTHSEWGITFSNVEAEAWYTSSASWVKTYFDVTALYRASSSTLPSAVLTAIASYASDNSYTVDDVEIVDLPSGDTDYFQVEFEKGSADVYANFSFDGTVL